MFEGFFDSPSFVSRPYGQNLEPLYRTFKDITQFKLLHF
jgi:hypothetical protein